MWVIQELCVARKVLVLCGTHRIQWDNLAKVAYLIGNESWLDVHHQLYSAVGRKLQLTEIIQIRELQMLWQLALLDQKSWSKIITGVKNFDATDPRDKIIALLGLRTEKPLIQPDYSLSVVATYRIATQAIISADNSIEILYHIKDRLYNSVPDLPSWVPDFSIRLKDDKFSPGTPIGGSGFNASGDYKANVAWPDHTNPDLLVTKAYIIDTILQVSEESESMKDAAIFCEWAQLALMLSEKHPDMSVLISSFWRTCVKDRSKDDIHPAPDHCFTEFSLYFTTTAVQEYLEKVPINPITTELIKEGVLPCLGEDLTQARLTSIQLWASPKRRRFYITQNGYMGLCQMSVTPGCQVCILPGGNVPFVIRTICNPDSIFQQFNLLGDSYIHGFIDGEALLKDNFEWQDIRIR